MSKQCQEVFLHLFYKCKNGGSETGKSKAKGHRVQKADRVKARAIEIMFFNILFLPLIIYIYVYVYIYTYIYMYVYLHNNVCTWVQLPRSKERGKALGLVLQAVASYPMWVMGTEVGSSTRATHVLNH